MHSWFESFARFRITLSVHILGVTFYSSWIIFLVITSTDLSIHDKELILEVTSYLKVHNKLTWLDSARNLSI